MKLRLGFVANSSSTAFVLSLGSLAAPMQKAIDRLEDRSDDLSRCTGKITDLDYWLKELQWEDSDGTLYGIDEEDAIKALIDQHDDLIIVRESDEEMGGRFRDVGLDYAEVAAKALLEFEYH